MHVLQPKHTKMSSQEVDKLLTELNISPTQLPKIKILDTALPESSEIGDIIKIERVIDGKKSYYYRVVSV
ncbi:MAG: DNA-directed RNA polymerase subunit RpoH/Rpb5 C-terminal domain-containing protein [Nanoarchaeota archaeon]|nr:DNA-directed RNA polymerase subunit RpoH/Rpb5 C-terminal domain-containing protein [Nanoarchaeota archaeon]